MKNKKLTYFEKHAKMVPSSGVVEGFPKTTLSLLNES